MEYGACGVQAMEYELRSEGLKNLQALAISMIVYKE